MTSLLVDLTEDYIPRKQNKPAKVLMSAEDLDHLLGEVEKKQNADARAALNLLQMITGSCQELATLD